jgi:hypothetical protein
MVVLNWSCERSVCRSSRPSGTSSTSMGLTENTALPTSVGNSRESRGGCGSTKPPGWSTFSSYAAQPGTTLAIDLRIAV